MYFKEFLFIFLWFAPAALRVLSPLGPQWSSVSPRLWLALFLGRWEMWIWIPWGKESHWTRVSHFVPQASHHQWLLKSRAIPAPCFLWMSSPHSRNESCNFFWVFSYQIQRALKAKTPFTSAAGEYPNQQVNLTSFCKVEKVEQIRWKLPKEPVVCFLVQSLGRQENVSTSPYQQPISHNKQLWSLLRSSNWHPSSLLLRKRSDPT